MLSVLARLRDTMAHAEKALTARRDDLDGFEMKWWEIAKDKEPWKRFRGEFRPDRLDKKAS